MQTLRKARERKIKKYFYRHFRSPYPYSSQRQHNPTQLVVLKFCLTWVTGLVTSLLSTTCSWLPKSSRDSRTVNTKSPKSLNYHWARNLPTCELKIKTLCREISRVTNPSDPSDPSASSSLSEWVRRPRSPAGWRRGGKRNNCEIDWSTSPANKSGNKWEDCPLNVNYKYRFYLPQKGRLNSLKLKIKKYFIVSRFPSNNWPENTSQ